MENRKGTIITITSNKGGVGKSIFTLNLAGVFSLLKRKVLVIDLNLYSGSLATYVNSENDKTIFNLIDDMSYNRYRNIDNYIYKVNDNISLIAAPKDPRNAYNVNPAYIPLILNNVVYKYDVILIDTDHLMNDTKLITLDNSDKKVVIVTNDISDLKNTRSFMEIKEESKMDNVYLLLNDSVNTNNEYFSSYDIKNILKANIDFRLPKSMNIKNIEKYLVDAKIPALDRKVMFKKDLDVLESIALELIKESGDKK